MNTKYYHDFIGADDVVNRFEILCSSTVTAKKIEATNTPFSLEYLDVKKLEPIQGSQASLRLLSKSVFQFTDLHTDDMQGYMVKFYRAGQLYWIGYLDSELYSENLTDSPPYPVEFSGADFNILERLKFRDEKEKAYTDINTLLTQLKRCFDKLGLPFQKLYIGCSTVPEGITSTSTETALHKLYIQSSNFYDEDGEPMSCREVVESILQPFGLMMVQRDANVYIYDLNTIKSGGVMKCYNFASLAYVGDTAVDIVLGDISDIGTMSTDASLGFEEMINNTTITSSLYADSVDQNTTIEEQYLSEEVNDDPRLTDRIFYSKSTNIENVQNGMFAIYYGRTTSNYVGERNTIKGCYADYFRLGALLPLYRVKYPNYITKVDSPGGRWAYPYYINLKMSVYPSTAHHPLLNKKEEGVGNSEILKLYCNLYVTDDMGKAISYYRILNDKGTSGWAASPNGVIEQGKCILWFCNENSKSSVLDGWIANANKTGIHEGSTGIIDASLIGTGIFVPPAVSGYLVFEITNKCEIQNSSLDGSVDASKIKMLLYDDINIDIVDEFGDTPSTDDYEFKSYINKKVEADFEKVTLKCISANEEMMPIGKANILKKTGTDYGYQLSYTRAGQTNILERLLMSTIHSNFTTKNKVISVDIKMTENPALRYVTYKSVLQSDGMYITGATLDFHNAVTTIKAVEFSADVDKLSDIPYE